MNEIQVSPAITRHPLLGGLVGAHGAIEIDAANYDAFAGPGLVVLFFAGDTVRYPESLDAAVILPELAKAFGGAFRIGLVRPEAEPALQLKFGVTLWPTLVLLRDGEYLGAIARLRDWAEYLRAIDTLRQGPAARPPSIGLAVKGGSEGCH
ncbi:MAG: hydrogenase [Sulfuricella sp.]|nr:hydrogenase [Sulfuricella sp.]